MSALNSESAAQDARGVFEVETTSPNRPKAVPHRIPDGAPAQAKDRLRPHTSRRTTAPPHARKTKHRDGARLRACDQALVLHQAVALHAHRRRPFFAELLTEFPGQADAAAPGAKKRQCNSLPRDPVLSTDPTNTRTRRSRRHNARTAMHTLHADRRSCRNLVGISCAAESCPRSRLRVDRSRLPDL